MRPWLVLAFGLAAAATGAAALLLGGGPAPGSDPHGEIDEASRQELRRILREDGR